jgi:Flp pilus assembly protein TadD
MLQRYAFQPTISSRAEIGSSLTTTTPTAAHNKSAVPYFATSSKLRLPIALMLGAALSACAPMAAKDNASPNVAANSAAAAPAPPHYPDHELDDATLYQLLMAEIASQRGMPEKAFIDEYNVAKDVGDARLARRATEFALMAHQAGGALQAARLWSQLDPSSEDARATLLTILVAQARLDEAEPILRDSLARSQNRELTFEQIGQTLARAADKKAAVALLQRLAQPYDNLPQAHLAIAQEAYGATQPSLAVSEAKRAAQLDGNDENAPVLAAQYLQSTDAAAAAATLEDFLRHHPNSVAVRMAYARFLAGQKRYEDSGAQFRIILKQHPHDAETLYALGLLAYQAERLPEAEEYFHRFTAVREGEPSSEDASDGDDDEPTPSSARSANAGYLYLAQIAEDEKNYPKALAALDSITDGDEFLTARLQHAAVLAKMGKLDEARKELHDMPAQNQRERIQIVLTEAQLLSDAKEGDQALTLLTDELKIYPGDPDLLYDEGMTAERLNRLDVMESSLRELIRIHPDNAQAYNALGYSWADRNMHLNEALDLIQKAMILSPDDASIIDSLGWAQYRLGDNKEALDNLMRAYQLRGDAEIAVHLGEVLWVSGRHDDAQKYWKEAEHKEPDNEVLHATLERFNVKIGER